MTAEATRLSLTVQFACDTAGLPDRGRMRTWVRAALRARAPGSATITLRFTDEAEARVLNRDYRHKDYATNVLSFPYAPAPDLAGDLVLCRQVLAREAQAQGKTLTAHCAHLLVHGVLHLQGYDHETGEADALAMETEERRILARLGFADPYAT